MAIITKEQIIALIDAKIAGQGSAVDIGGALPAILKGLADMGISSDMSETEQMQARKNLGLYYEETTTEEKTAEYTDEQTGIVATKISDDVPTKEDIIGVTNSEGTPNDFEIQENENYIEVIATASLSPLFAVVYEAGAGFFSESGIYIYTDSIGNRLLYRYPTEVVSKIPERFLPEQSGGVVYAEVTTIPVPGMSLSDFTAAGFTDAVMRGFADHTIAGFVINDGTGTFVFPISSAGMSSMDGYPQYSFSFLFRDTQRTVIAQPGMQFLRIQDASSPVTLLAVPTQPTSEIVTFMSVNDFNRLANAETNVAKMADGTTFIVTVDKRMTGTTKLYFYNKDGIEFTITYVALTSIPVYLIEPYTLDTPKAVILSALPTSSMTTQEELDAIGLTVANIENLADGTATALVYSTATKYRAGIVTASYVDSFTYSLAFEVSDNRYSITKMLGSLSITVTPLS